MAGKRAEAGAVVRVGAVADLHYTKAAQGTLQRCEQSRTTTAKTFGHSPGCLPTVPGWATRPRAGPHNVAIWLVWHGGMPVSASTPA